MQHCCTKIEHVLFPCNMLHRVYDGFEGLSTSTDRSNDEHLSQINRAVYFRIC